MSLTVAEDDILTFTDLTRFMKLHLQGETKSLPNSVIYIGYLFIVLSLFRSLPWNWLAQAINHSLNCYLRVASERYKKNEKLKRKTKFEYVNEGETTPVNALIFKWCSM